MYHVERQYQNTSNYTYSPAGFWSFPSRIIIILPLLVTILLWLLGGISVIGVKKKLTNISEGHAVHRLSFLMSNCQLGLFSLESNFVKSSCKVMLAVTAMKQCLPRVSHCLTEACLDDPSIAWALV